MWLGDGRATPPGFFTFSFLCARAPMQLRVRRGFSSREGVRGWGGGRAFAAAVGWAAGGVPMAK